LLLGGLLVLEVVYLGGSAKINSLLLNLDFLSAIGVRPTSA